MEPKKFDYVDSLRGLAILLVMLLHIGESSVAFRLFPGPLRQFIDNGQFGVQLFFIVSAYTLMHSYYSRQQETYTTRDFFIRRFFRIAPLYYLGIIYFLFQNIIGFGILNDTSMHQVVSIKEVIANALFINAFFPDWINHVVSGGWSISVEFIFYFTFPFICKYIKSLNASVLFLIGALLFASFLRLHHILGNSMLDKNNFLYWYFPTQLPVFALGIVTYFFLHKREALHPQTLFAISFALLFYCYLTVPLYYLYSMSFAMLLIVLSQKDLKLFVNPVTRYIGKISFSMYLIHFAVLFWVLHIKIISVLLPADSKRALLDLIGKYLLVGSITVLISHFTYHYIELPFQRVGKRLIHGKNPE